MIHVLLVTASAICGGSIGFVALDMLREGHGRRAALTIAAFMGGVVLATVHP